VGPFANIVSQVDTADPRVVLTAVRAIRKQTGRSPQPNALNPSVNSRVECDAIALYCYFYAERGADWLTH
jgi:hypothetical protein